MSELDRSVTRPAWIELDPTPLGQGGFGVVHHVARMDGRAGGSYVAKLLTHADLEVSRRGHATILALQERLRDEERAARSTGGRTLVDVHPGLLGAPLAAFTGRASGQPVRGYLSFNLAQRGMEDFGAILDDPVRLDAYQALPLPSRLALAEQLVDTFDFLSNRARFIHADVKAQALFVDVRAPRCALIDFDSGALARGPDDCPATYGTQQDWLAPEIVQQLVASAATTRMVRVDLHSDMWAVTIGVHYLLFGLHPLFFLSELSDRSMAAYLGRFSWPDVDSSCPWLARDLEALHRRYVRHLRTRVPDAIVARLSSTINAGYRNPALRTTYGQWKSVLGAAARPEILSFEVDRPHVVDLRPVRLAWETRGVGEVTLSGHGVVPGKGSMQVVVRRPTQFALTIAAAGRTPLTRSVRVTVSEAPPVIRSFTANPGFLSSLTPVTLSWAVDGAEQVEIDGGVGAVGAVGSRHLPVRVDQIFTLTARSPFGVASRATARVQVSRAAPLIVTFRADPPVLLAGGTTVLRWDVRGAATVRIEPAGGDVPARGERRIHAADRFVLTAISEFGVRSVMELAVTVLRPSALGGGGRSRLGVLPGAPQAGGAESPAPRTALLSKPPDRGGRR